MTDTLYRLALCVVLASVAGAASSQNETADSALERDGSDATRHWREKCFLVSAVLHLQVMSDRHVYVRTRDNHYILTTPQCEDLERSGVRGEVQLVNYGRRVCQDDGSYFLYHSGMRETTCAILTIDSVEDRAEAKLIAAGNGDLVDVEVIDTRDPVDSVDSVDPVDPVDPADPPDLPARWR